MGTNSVLPYFLETDEQDFETDVLKVAGFTLVSFYRDTCAYCKAFEPILSAFAQRNASKIRCVRIEVAFDNDDDFKHKYKILGEPTVHLYHNGRLLYYIRGASAEPEFTAAVMNGLAEAVTSGLCPVALQLEAPHESEPVFQLVVPRVPPAPPAPSAG